CREKRSRPSGTTRDRGRGRRSGSLTTRGAGSSRPRPPARKTTGSWCWRTRRSRFPWSRRSSFAREWVRQFCAVMELIRRPTMRVPLGPPSVVPALSWTTVLCLTIPTVARQDVPPAQLPEVRVGIDEGDLRGSDQRVLQSAVDYLAGLGGGTV